MRNRRGMRHPARIELGDSGAIHRASGGAGSTTGSNTSLPPSRVEVITRAGCTRVCGAAAGRMTVKALMKPGDAAWSHGRVTPAEAASETSRNAVHAHDHARAAAAAQADDRSAAMAASTSGEI